MAPKLRLITQEHLGYFTGMSAAHHTQCLIGFLPLGLVLLQFTLEGEFVGIDVEPFQADMWTDLSRSPVRHAGQDPIPRPFQRLAHLQTQIGFNETPITLDPFSLEPAYPVVLDIVSGMTRYTVAHPDEFEPEEVVEAQEEIARWTDKCEHAFTWNEEVMLRPDGRLAST
jgi:hypothetical protein